MNMGIQAGNTIMANPTVINAGAQFTSGVLGPPGPSSTLMQGIGSGAQQIIQWYQDR